MNSESASRIPSMLRWHAFLASAVLLSCGGHTAVEAVRPADASRDVSRDGSTLPEASTDARADVPDACNGAACACMPVSACRTDFGQTCPTDWAHICDSIPAARSPPGYSKSFFRCGPYYKVSGTGLIDITTSSNYEVYYAASGELLGARIGYNHLTSGGTITDSPKCQAYVPSFSPDQVPACTRLSCSTFPGCKLKCGVPSDGG